MILTQAQALTIVSLATMKTELRIPAGEVSHDALLSEQITNAANFVAQSTGLALADLPPVAAAIIAAARDLYNGNREVSEDAAQYAWLAPYRSYKAE